MNNEDKLKIILNRIDSYHMAKLWLFYFPYFSNDQDCLCFLYNVLCNEPERKQYLSASASNNIDKTVFVPRKMLNAVQSLVTIAHNLGSTYAGKDVSKIVYLITCAETLQTLANHQRDRTSKAELLRRFFDDNISKDDRAFISDRFCCIMTRELLEIAQNGKGSKWGNITDHFTQFLIFINEYRNRAVHEGEFWDVCFVEQGSNSSLTLSIPVDEKSLGREKGKKETYAFESCLSYIEFEQIFVRTSITLIQKYIADQS